MASTATLPRNAPAGRGRSPAAMSAIGVTVGLLAGLLEALVRLIVAWCLGDAARWSDLPLVWVAPALYACLGGGMAGLAGWIWPQSRFARRWSGRAAEVLPRLAVVVIVLGVAATALGQWRQQRLLAALPPPAAGSAPLLLLIVPGLTPERLEAASRDADGLPNLHYLAGQRWMTCDSVGASVPAADVAAALVIEAPERGAGGLLARLQKRGYAVGLLLASDNGDGSAWRRRGAHYDAGQSQPLQAMERTLLGKLARNGAAWFVDARMRRQAGDLHHALMDWIDDLGDRPFLAILVYDGLAPSRSKDGPDDGSPDAALCDFDRQLGTLLDRLRLHELEDRTLVVLAGAETPRIPLALHLPQVAAAKGSEARLESWAAVSEAISAALDRPAEGRP